MEMEEGKEVDVEVDSTGKEIGKLLKEICLARGNVDSDLPVIVNINIGVTLPLSGLR
ncbi:MAG: hypothetical protein HQK97_04560 [Nitrospirae bacterium]|nr:hypothetical protein [Nitrospirota bacterium]